jgi:hypothetical protein
MSEAAQERGPTRDIGKREGGDRGQPGGSREQDEVVPPEVERGTAGSFSRLGYPGSLPGRRQR